MSARDVIAEAIWRYEREICGGPDEDYARWRAADPETDAIYMTHAGSVLAALRAAGYAVVPVEPTEAILRAASKLDWNAQTDPTWREIYAVMLTAAQEPTP